MSYTPVHDNMYDSIIDVGQKVVGWGGIEFFIFIGALVIFLVMWNFTRKM